MMLQRFSILLLFLLLGCASSTHHVVEHGDWTLEDERSEPMGEFEEQRSLSCPRGTKQWCIRRLGRESCNCITESDFRDRIRSMHQ